MKNTQHFTMIELSNSYKIIKFIYTKEILEKAKIQAREKSKYTMEFSQSSNTRNSELKFQRQLRGTLAEIAIKMLLEEFFSQNNIEIKIIRWDDVRTDGFKSPKNEYDIKIIYKGVEFLLESRSSVSYKTTINEALYKLDVIGPYVSTFKKSEKKSDFYIRPLYQYNELKNQIIDSETEDYLDKDKMSLFLMCGITYEELIKNGYKSSLGQGNTEYYLIKIIKCQDIISFLETLKNIILSSQSKLTDY